MSIFASLSNFDYCVWVWAEHSHASPPTLHHILMYYLCLCWLHYSSLPKLPILPITLFSLLLVGNPLFGELAHISSPDLLEPTRYQIYLNVWSTIYLTWTTIISINHASSRTRRCMVTSPTKGRSKTVILVDIANGLSSGSSSVNAVFHNTINQPSIGVRE